MVAFGRLQFICWSSCLFGIILFQSEGEEKSLELRDFLALVKSVSALALLVRATYSQFY